MTEGVNAVHLAFDNSITVVLRVDGQVRPRSEEGHEHFVGRIGLFFVVN